ncbi:MAG TPA: basic secretory protein-like protein, partial [archaeon]|nr:basic secretory protein-like protein [archaeon]
NLGLSPGDFETYKAFVDKACFEYVGGIAELFKSEPPENIKVSFTSSPEEHAGRENSGAVELNLKSLRFPHEAINVMVHEAAHVIQGYPAGAPNWAVEGIADYAVLRLRPSLLDTVLIRNCTPRFDYTETDYGCIAFFLLEASENSTCGNDLVVKMNERLRAGGGDADLDAGFRECGFESVQAAWKQHGPL